MRTVNNTYLSTAISLAGVVCCILSLVQPVFAATSPFTQTDWSGGQGQSAFTDSDKYDSGTNINSSTAGEITLSATSGWFNNAWGYRKQITFDNAEQSEDLVDFPVLVTLNAGNFDYSKAKSAGADIRFTDSDGTTELNYEIESWNSSGDSFVWVKVPQIDGSSDTDSIYIYYGNSSASDGQSINAVWNSDFAFVNHMKETTGDVLADSTANGNILSKISGAEPGPVAGKINGAQDFDGDGDYASASNSQSLNISGNWTISGWFKDDHPDGLNHDVANIITKGDVDASGDVPYFVQLGFRFLSVGYSNGFSSGSTNIGYNLTNGGFAGGSWIHFAAKYSTSGNTLTLFVNGNQVAQNTFGTANNGGTGLLSVGRRASGSSDWNGGLDELRIAATDFSADWIAATYLSENNEFNTFGSEQGQYLASGTLTSSIFDTEDAESFGELTFAATTPEDTAATVKVRTSNAADMSGAEDFADCDSISSGADISANNCVTDGHRYIQYQIELTTTDPAVTPTFTEISIPFTSPAPPEPDPDSDSNQNSDSSSSSSSTDPPSCNDSTPAAIPDIVKLIAGSDNIDLYFNPVSANATGYAISYGLSRSASDFGVQIGHLANGPIKQRIDHLLPATVYYLKIRTVNGCNAGAWSQVQKISTQKLTNSLVALTKTQNNLPPKITASSSITKTFESSPTATPKAQPLASLDELTQITKPKWHLPDISQSFEFIFKPLINLQQNVGFIQQSLSKKIASTFQIWFKSEPLTITEVKVAKIGEGYVYISWKTNIPASSKVNFGDSFDYGKDVQSTQHVREHFIKLENLEKGKAYYYEVMSQSEDGQYAYDARHEFVMSD